MDAGVAAGLLQVAATPTLSTVHVFPSRVAASKRPAAPRGCGGAGPSAASALLSDAPRHRPRRASLHPAPRRSHRRSTPFSSSLLERPACPPDCPLPFVLSAFPPVILSALFPCHPEERSDEGS